MLLAVAGPKWKPSAQPETLRIVDFAQPAAVQLKPSSSWNAMRPAGVSEV